MTRKQFEVTWVFRTKETRERKCCSAPCFYHQSGECFRMKEMGVPVSECKVNHFNVCEEFCRPLK